MSRSLGACLPAELVTLLSGDNLAEKVGHTFLLLTVDQDGWPRVAMLSAGEVVATGPSELWLALWAESGSTANLSRGRVATLVIVLSPNTYYLKLRAASPEGLLIGEMRLAAYRCIVEDALLDTVPYARVTTGIEFEIAESEPGATLARWRAVVDEMRGAADRPAGGQGESLSANP